MSNLLNNTSIRVKIKLHDLIQKAYKQLLVDRVVPYTTENSNSGLKPDYDVVKDKDQLVAVEFYLSPVPEEVPVPEPVDEPYQPGDWKEEEASA